MPHSQPFYRYTTYGLVIDSSMLLPELAANRRAIDSAVIPDVIIRCGTVPTQLENAQSTIGFTQIGANETLLNLTEPYGARFLVRNGGEIVLDISQPDKNQEQRLTILGYCLTALLFQRDCLVLHANAVSVRHQAVKGAVAISGKTGAGKSTLTAALLKRQHKLIADDVTAIDFQNGIYVLPGYPRLKLWGDTLRYLGKSKTSLHRVIPELDKFSYPVNGAFHGKTQRLKAIYILAITDVTTPTLTILQGAQKLEAIIRQIRSYAPQQLPQGPSWIIENCAAIAQHCQILFVERPFASDSIEAVTDLVEASMEKL